MNPEPHKLSLFDVPVIRLGAVSRSVKLALNRAAANSQLSREEIVHKASSLANGAGINLCKGGNLGLATINKWLDINALGYMPSILGLIVLCQVLNDSEAIKPILETLNLEVIGPEEQRFKEIGKASVQMKKLRKRLRELEDK